MNYHLQARCLMLAMNVSNRSIIIPVREENQVPSQFVTCLKKELYSRQVWPTVLPTWGLYVTNLPGIEGYSLGRKNVIWRLLL